MNMKDRARMHCQRDGCTKTFTPTRDSKAVTFMYMLYHGYDAGENHDLWMTSIVGHPVNLEIMDKRRAMSKIPSDAILGGLGGAGSSEY
jgi:hypothetical protein